MTATEQALKITQLAAQAAADKLGQQIVAFDVSDHLAITDVFLVISATNDRQVGAIVDGIEEELLKHDFKPKRREGERENRWVLLDYIDVVVHVQHSEERQLYSLERLWKDCPRIEVTVDGAQTEEQVAAVQQAPETDVHGEALDADAPDLGAEYRDEDLDDENDDLIDG